MFILTGCIDSYLTKNLILFFIPYHAHIRFNGTYSNHTEQPEQFDLSVVQCKSG